MRPLSLSLVTALLVACGDTGVSSDDVPKASDASPADAEPMDAQPAPDATNDAAPPPDAATTDAPSPMDAPALPDAPAPDATAPPDVPTQPDRPVTPDAPAPPDAAVTCAVQGEVVVYTASGWNALADGLRDAASPCAHYYLSIPAVDDGTGHKTMPRTAEAARMRARGARFHALAEFHWTSWNNTAGMTWLAKGVEFRRRMAAAGYDVAAGDGWAINELPSAARTDLTVQRAIRDVVRGLHDGASGAPAADGAVFIIGTSSANMNPTAALKPEWETWLSRADFWVDMNRYVRWWAQETYASPAQVCVASAMVGERARSLNEFAMYPARLAAAGPASAATARSYLGRAYVPVHTAVWRSTEGYGDTVVPMATMQNFVSTAVYATRAWAATHPYADGRIGLAWDRQTSVTDADLAPLIDRTAAALAGAYGPTGMATRACSPSGAFTWCQCEVAGAAFNPRFGAAFDAW